MRGLEPDASVDQMFAVGDGDLIAESEEIARCREIAAGIGAAVGDLRSAVERGAAADDQRADGLAGMNPARAR